MWPCCHRSRYSHTVSVSPLYLPLPPVPGDPLPVLAGNVTTGTDTAGALLNIPCQVLAQGGGMGEPHPLGLLLPSPWALLPMFR